LIKASEEGHDLCSILREEPRKGMLEVHAVAIER